MCNKYKYQLKLSASFKKFLVGAAFEEGPIPPPPPPSSLLKRGCVKTVLKLNPNLQTKQFSDFSTGSVRQFFLVQKTSKLARDVFSGSTANFFSVCKSGEM